MCLQSDKLHTKISISIRSLSLIDSIDLNIKINIY